MKRQRDDPSIWQSVRQIRIRPIQVYAALFICALFTLWIWSLVRGWQ